MKSLFKMLRILAIAIIATSASGSVLDLTHICKNEPNGAFIPHPFDCQAYFVCNIIPKIQYCDEGLHFDAKRTSCNWPEFANCQTNSEYEDEIYNNFESSEDGNALISGHTSSFIAIDADTRRATNPMAKYDPSHIECRHFGAYFLPHPTDCQHYFICAYGYLHIHQCGSNTFWNYKTSQCVLASEAQCYSNILSANEPHLDSTTIGTTTPSTSTISNTRTTEYPSTGDTTTPWYTPTGTYRPTIDSTNTGYTPTGTIDYTSTRFTPTGTIDDINTGYTPTGTYSPTIDYTTTGYPSTGTYRPTIDYTTTGYPSTGTIDYTTTGYPSTGTIDYTSTRFTPTGTIDDTNTGYTPTGTIDYTSTRFTPTGTIGDINTGYTPTGTIDYTNTGFTPTGTIGDINTGYTPTGTIDYTNTGFTPTGTIGDINTGYTPTGTIDYTNTGYTPTGTYSPTIDYTTTGYPSTGTIDYTTTGYPSTGTIDYTTTGYPSTGTTTPRTPVPTTSSEYLTGSTPNFSTSSPPSTTEFPITRTTPNFNPETVKEGQKTPYFPSTTLTPPTTQYPSTGTTPNFSTKEASNPNRPPKKPSARPSTTKGDTEAPNLTLSCPIDRQSYLPHIRDCSKYFICIVGMPVLTSCPEGLYWNQVDEFCDSPKNVNCSNKPN